MLWNKLSNLITYIHKYIKYIKKELYNKLFLINRSSYGVVVL